MAIYPFTRLELRISFLYKKFYLFALQSSQFGIKGLREKTKHFLEVIKLKKQKRFNKLMNEVRDLAWKFYQLGKLSECREITLEVYGPGKLMSDSKPYQYKKLKLAYQLMQSKYRKILLAEITKFENLLEEFEQR